MPFRFYLLNSMLFQSNQPFAPADRRSAKELTASSDTVYRAPGDNGVEPGISSLRRTLVKGWKDVDILTRK